MGIRRSRGPLPLRRRNLWPRAVRRKRPSWKRPPRRLPQLASGTGVSGEIAAIAIAADAVAATSGVTVVNARLRSRPRGRGKSRPRGRNGATSPQPARPATVRFGTSTTSRHRHRHPPPGLRGKSGGLMPAATSGVAGIAAAMSGRASPAAGMNVPGKTGHAKSGPVTIARGRIGRATSGHATIGPGGDQTAVGRSPRELSPCGPSGRPPRGTREMKTKRPSTCPSVEPARKRPRQVARARPGQPMKESGVVAGAGGGSPAEPKARRA